MHPDQRVIRAYRIIRFYNDAVRCSDRLARRFMTKTEGMKGVHKGNIYMPPPSVKHTRCRAKRQQPSSSTPVVSPSNSEIQPHHARPKPIRFTLLNGSRLQTLGHKQAHFHLRQTIVTCIRQQTLRIGMWIPKILQHLANRLSLAYARQHNQRKNMQINLHSQPRLAHVSFVIQITVTE